MNCLALSDLEQFAAALADGIRAELYLTPKPGLVDLCDNGSHDDLTLELMNRSAGMMREYLAELAVAIYRQQPFPELQQIGLKAEQRMLAELQSNCHRGGIFLSGLLLSAYGECRSDNPEALSNAVARLAQRHFLQARLTGSHGQQARARYHTGGIIAECLNGLPGLFQIALPSLIGNLNDLAGSCYLAMARLMQHCDDTTCLHRGGQTGLARLRKAGQELELCLLRGADPVPLLRRQNQEFKTANLTMGGVADLLGLTFGYLDFTNSRHGISSLSLHHKQPSSCPA
ncbi:triphosphoribosyl-dephospho-CoA synthase [Malonomonas rubra DSM 5091]|uniref:triphosphoribosyl-dephospho-CoA synthase n=1 Tax=Malonomonas rubra DSM 5091 TaxID=1122189 RepID=A0A1M6G6L9_MALRU|nr:triphosphoribosyl-dephospho-CoA synthase [Malonomonas rubra]SHJ05631.1 triphosphoribosyl-dephospho-CoA synthase [Malonomonas rubra DSM 5091]